MIGRISVGTRIYGGFGLVLTLLCVVAVILTSALSSSHSHFNTYSKVGDNAVRVATIQGDVIEMRRNVVMVAAHNDVAAEAQVRRMQDELRRLLPQALAEMRDDKRRANLTRMQAIFDEYVGHFDRVAKLHANKEHLITERMNVVGGQARKNLTQIVHTAMADGDFEAAALAGMAEEALMLARLNANKFLAEPSPELARDANLNAEKFTAEAEALVKRLHNPARKALAIEAEKLAKDYEAAFQNVVDATMELDTLVYKTMAALGVEFSALAQETGVSQESFLSSLQTETIDTMDHAGLLGMATAIAALVLGLVISYLIAHGITQPVRAMTGAMKLLAQGDKTVDEPSGRDRPHGGGGAGLQGQRHPHGSDGRPAGGTKAPRRGRAAGGHA